MSFKTGDLVGHNYDKNLIGIITAKLDNSYYDYEVLWLHPNTPKPVKHTQNMLRILKDWS